VKAPQRGEVWLVDLGMTAKVRPALVLEQDFGLGSGTPGHVVKGVA
jgi:mRNA-degrading endonuclease toxin of MazEF toxin-antitoxin module